MSSAINKATMYLESQFNGVRDSYTLSIVCYALASAESRTSAACFEKLNKAAITDG